MIAGLGLTVLVEILDRAREPRREAPLLLLLGCHLPEFLLVAPKEFKRLVSHCSVTAAAAHAAASPCATTRPLDVVDQIFLAVADTAAIAIDK